MRIPVRTSRLAKWSRRLASLTLPLVVISILMHRAMLLASESFTFILLASSLLAAAAFVLSVAAFARLWHSGDQGWAKAIQALGISLVVLSPLVAAGYLAYNNPAANDVATAPFASLPLLYAENPLSKALVGDVVRVHFPNARTRAYQLGATNVYAIIEALIFERGWEMRRKRGPVSDAATGQINAIATSWFGWRDEIVIVVNGAADGTVVAMRSASFYSSHDLGTNGRRIDEFMLALDAAITDALTASFTGSIAASPGNAGD